MRTIAKVEVYFLFVWICTPVRSGLIFFFIFLDFFDSVLAPCLFVFSPPTVSCCVVLFPGAIHDDPTRAATGLDVWMSSKSVLGKICVMILFILIPEILVSKIMLAFFSPAHSDLFRGCLCSLYSQWWPNGKLAFLCICLVCLELISAGHRPISPPLLSFGHSLFFKIHAPRMVPPCPDSFLFLTKTKGQFFLWLQICLKNIFFSGSCRYEFPRFFPRKMSPWEPGRVRLMQIR